MSAPTPRDQTTLKGGRSLMSECACVRRLLAPYIVHCSASRKSRTVTSRCCLKGMRTVRVAYPGFEIRTGSAVRRLIFTDARPRVFA